MKPTNTGYPHLFLTYPNMSLKFPIHGLSVSFPGNVSYCSDSSLFLSAIPLFLQFGEGMPILSPCNQAFPFTRIHGIHLFWGILRPEHYISFEQSVLFLLGWNCRLYYWWHSLFSLATRKPGGKLANKP